MPSIRVRASPAWRSQSPRAGSFCITPAPSVLSPRRTLQCYGGRRCTTTSCDNRGGRRDPVTTRPRRYARPRVGPDRTRTASPRRSARCGRLDPIDLAGRGRRDRHAARAVRVRQDDVAPPDRRPREPDLRLDHRRRRDARRRPRAQADRVRAPVAGTAAVADRRGQRPPAARHQPSGLADRPLGDDRRVARRGRPRRVPRRLPARAVGRNAAAGRARPGVRARRADPVDGRAVRRARRDDPDRHAPPPRTASRTARHDRRVRDALDRRGRVPVRPRRGDVERPGRITDSVDDPLAHPRLPSWRTATEFFHVETAAARLRCAPGAER